MYLFIDTETTGLSKESYLVQIAALLYDEDKKLIKEYSSIVKPRDEIPLGSVEKHGITTEKALKEGKDIDLVLTEIEDMTKMAKIMVFHNYNYDYSIISNEFQRLNRPNPLFKLRPFCTMATPSILNFYGKESKKLDGSYGFPKLMELHNRLFGCDFDGAHNAISDVAATAKCFFKLKEMKVI